MITKKGDGSQVKESTDSSTTIEDDDVKGMFHLFVFHFLFLILNLGIVISYKKYS